MWVASRSGSLQNHFSQKVVVPLNQRSPCLKLNCFFMMILKALMYSINTLLTLLKACKLLLWHSRRFFALKTCPPKTVEQLDDKFCDHPSEVRIKAMQKSPKKFSFSHITPVGTYKAFLALNSRKAASGRDS